MRCRNLYAMQKPSRFEVSEERMPSMDQHR